MDMAFARQVFIEETEELLALIGSSLLDEISGKAKAKPHINEIFRAVHTIKGSAALFGFDTLVNYCHELENLLQQARDGALLINADFSSLLFEAYTYLQQQLYLMQQGNTPVVDAAYQSQLARFKALSEQVPLKTDLPPENQEYRYKLTFSYSAHLFQEGADPAEHIQFLQGHGTVTDIELLSDFPVDFDPTLCYLQLRLVLQTPLDSQQLQACFQFLPADSHVDITPLFESEASAAVASPQGEPSPSQLAQPRANNKPEALFLRVEARKLDRLINLIGELVTQGASADLQLRLKHYEQLEETFSGIQQLVSDMRESALSLRMLPVADSFRKLQHLVLELGPSLGKQITLQFTGGETELDKGMLDKLADPLLHLVRNAVDHGIELPATRLNAGKNPMGLLTLSAAYEAGTVLIRLTDDGAGIDIAKVRAKAISNGLLDAAEPCNDEAIYQLLFAPGFSTAKTVSNVSGRGVGLDVVKRGIDALRGQVAISSSLGKGSTFEIRVPLTLSIIDGFMCQVANLTLIVPQNMIQECLAVSQQKMQQRMLLLRDELVPVIVLHEIFGLNSLHTRQQLIVVQFGPTKAALLVDELLGDIQAVIKPLHPLFRPVKAVSGTTLLNDGSVGFVLDVPALVALATAQEKHILGEDLRLQEKAHE